MAQKKIITFVCDRCGMEHQRLRGKNLPAGWSHVAGKDLCPQCIKSLIRFLEGKSTSNVVVEQGVVKQALRRSSDDLLERQSQADAEDQQALLGVNHAD